jgi:acetyltransferase-like isoleucine patch superfamily enzyme
MHSWLELDGPGTVIVGDDCVIASMPGAKREHVTLFTNSRAAVIQIGNGVQLYGVRMSCKHAITVHDGAVIEDAAIADTDFHSTRAARTDAVEDPALCRVVIGKQAAIGSWSVICKGVAIGNEARVIAGSVVRKNVPDGATVLGNPARPLV